MGKKMVGVLLLLVIGAVLLVGGKYLMTYLNEKQQRTTSDAATIKGHIRIATDSRIGYFPLCSSEMKRDMHRLGWRLECIDDQADYRDRMAKLADRKYDLAVATVDSYLLNAQAHDYPGAIIAVLDESKGGDAIVARKERVANLDGVRTAHGLKVAFTPNSPSHYPLKAAAGHFDLPGLLPVDKELRLETEGSAKALAKLLTGGADIAVLWEPDVSRALAEPGVIKLLGTEETERLIVDILIANRKFMQQKPEVINQLLTTYFRVLKKYREDPDRLLSEVTKETGLDRDKAQAMLHGVGWQGLLDNCEQWFGIAGPGAKAEERIISTIDSTVDILISAGDFSRSPLPDSDSYRLVKRSFLEELYGTSQTGFKQSNGGFTQTGQDKTTLPPLDAKGWEALSEVGTLRLKPINFRTGSHTLDTFAELELDQAAEKLSHYPSFRVLIKGHTGTRGDAEQNRLLSRQRSESVADYLINKRAMSPNRLRPLGYGGYKPLPQDSHESERGFQQRLPRVELVLVREQL